MSSSFKSFPRVAPGSLFSNAIQELFVDAALRNFTAINAAGDGGSGDEYPNGLTNVAATHASAYSLVAGGASLSTISSAGQDATLNGLNAAYPDIYAAAMAGDPATLWELVAGGLKVLPSSADPTATLVETAWNQYSVSNDFIHNYLNNNSGSVEATPPQRSLRIRRPSASTCTRPIRRPCRDAACPTCRRHPAATRPTACRSPT